MIKRAQIGFWVWWGERKDTTHKSDKSYSKKDYQQTEVISFGNGGDSSSKAVVLKLWVATPLGVK